MSEPQVLISIDTRKNLESEEFLSLFFRQWFNNFPELIPERAGNFEPIRERINTTTKCVKISMNNPFIWARQSGISSSGTLFHGGNHFCTAFRVRSSWNRGFRWEYFFDWLCEKLNPEFGYLHLITEQEKANPEIPPRAAYDFFLGAHMKTIEQNGIPNLGWKTYFGGTIVERFSLNILPESTLTISKELDDIESNFAKFAESRKAKLEEIELFLK